MKNSYHDILVRIPEPPKWWDENGTPRYCDFSPENVANPYANETVLLEIACQLCNQKFLAALSTDTYNPNYLELKAAINDEFDGLNYGDPPRSLQECCAAGYCTTSETRRILEFWKRVKGEWIRVPELERKIGDYEKSGAYR